MNKNKCPKCGRESYTFDKIDKKKQDKESKSSNENEEQQEGQGQVQGNEPCPTDENGNCQNQGEMDGQFDSHDDWSQDEDSSSKETLRDILKSAAEEAKRSNRGWGSIPNHIRDKVIDYITPQIAWRQQLRYFAKTSKRYDKSSTVRRLNRKTPYIHPGRRIDRTANLAISVDMSGSVSDEMLSAFFTEIASLSKFVSITVIPFDHEVVEDAVFVWKKGKGFAQKATRVANGGTCFDAPTNWVNERNFDGHIILTDMQAPMPNRSKCQRMWITDETNYNQPYFKPNEKMIYIPDRDLKKKAA